MFIAIRKEPNGALYMDKNIYSRTQTTKLTLDAYAQFKKHYPNLAHTCTEAEEWVDTKVDIFNEETQEIETKIERELVHYVYVTNKVYTDEQLSKPPYNYTKVEIDDKYSDCVGRDFNEDLTFSIEKYNARKQKELAEHRIAELKALLKDYDYIGTKIATGRGTREEYAKEIAQMTEWANEINELEQYKAKAKLEVENGDIR